MEHSSCRQQNPLPDTSPRQSSRRLRGLRLKPPRSRSYHAASVGTPKISRGFGR